jgi:hypothetical protein
MAKLLKAKGLVADGKDILFDLLKLEGIEMVTMDFSGDEDSGQVDAPLLWAEGKAQIRQGFLAQVVQGSRISEGTRWVNGKAEQVIRENVSVKRLLEYVTCDILSEVCDGWENGPGAFGSFIFDVKKRKVGLEFNERFVETKLTEWRV